MADGKKNESGRGYRLMFVPYMGGEDYSFSYFETLNLEEIDDFTSRFDNVDDMLKYINYRNGKNKLDVISTFIERIGGKHTRYEVMYRNDIFDSDKVVLTYKEYLLKHLKYFYNSSPVRYVNLFREDYELESDYIKKCCYAYFSDNNYRKIRGAYFELKELGLSKNVVSKVKRRSIDELDSSQYFYYSKDNYLNELLNRGEEPDWEKINNDYTLEQTSLLIKKEPKDFSGRGRR